MRRLIRRRDRPRACPDLGEHIAPEAFAFCAFELLVRRRQLYPARAFYGFRIVLLEQMKHFCLYRFRYRIPNKVTGLENFNADEFPFIIVFRRNIGADFNASGFRIVGNRPVQDIFSLEVFHRRLTHRINLPSRKQLITAYQRRLEDRVIYPVSAERTERTTYRRCLEYQVRRLARVILGEEDHYRAFLVR